MFGGGQQFVFNLGGGPGFRVHQFGGGRPRRRPRDANGQQDEQQQTMLGLLTNLLPLIILFVLPLISSLLPGDSSPSLPDVRFASKPPFTLQRVMPETKVNYFLKPQSIEDYTPKMLKNLDQNVERSYVANLRLECQGERQLKARLYNQAQGFIFQDKAKMQEAERLEMRSCQRLVELKIRFDPY